MSQPDPAAETSADLHPQTSWRDTVPRLAAPDPQTFWDTYVRTQTPAIFEGMFAGQPIRALKTRAAVRERLGSMQLQFKGEYVEHFLDQVYGRPSDPMIGQMLSFDAYCDHVDRHPETAGWMGQEKVPPILSDLFQIPPHCTRADGLRDEHPLVHTFIGHPGKSASLHIDTDYKQVLVYEIYGRKRVYLIPSRACLPLRTAGFISRLELKGMTETERVDLVTRLGGWCATLYPGDTLFLPFSLYHHFEYLDHAMSINIRFGRNRYHDVFNRYMVPHWGLHALAAKLTTEAQVEHEGRELYRQILEAFEAEAASAYARYQRIANRLEALCHESGTVSAYPEIERERQQSYYEVPEIATEFIPRFRIDFQKGYWHRQRLDLSPWRDGHEAGRQQARTAEAQRPPAPDFHDPAATSIFAIIADLSQIAPERLEPDQGLIALWLRAEFDLFLSEGMSISLIAADDQTKALVNVSCCRYDGRYQGSNLIRFVGTQTR